MESQQFLLRLEVAAVEVLGAWWGKLGVVVTLTLLICFKWNLCAWPFKSSLMRFLCGLFRSSFDDNPEDDPLFMNTGRVVGQVRRDGEVGS